MSESPCRPGAPLPEIPIEVIVEHFRDLMSPGNMFVVPKQWAGIAEVPEFIEAFASGEDTV